MNLLNWPSPYKERAESELLKAWAKTCSPLPSFNYWVGFSLFQLFIHFSYLFEYLRSNFFEEALPSPSATMKSWIAFYLLTTAMAFHFPSQTPTDRPPNSIPLHKDDLINARQQHTRKLSPSISEVEERGQRNKVGLFNNVACSTANFNIALSFIDYYHYAFFLVWNQRYWL